jgi:D-lactate dehydrogenase
MKMAFVETEPSERALFERAFLDHELEFVAGLEEVSAGCEVLSVFIYSKVDGAFLERHPGLKLVATRSTTWDHIEVEECERRGVQVCRVPTYGSYTVAEHTMTLILALSRRLQEILAMPRRERFSYEAIRGSEVRGKTLGVIGSGRIGLHLIPLAKAFGMEVLAYDINPQPEAAEALGFVYLPLDKLLRRAQIISLHATLTPASWHMFNAEVFARCRRGVLLVNTARGGLVDTEALLEALDQGLVGGVALDVLEEERVMRAEAARIIANQIVARMHAAMGQDEIRLTDPGRIRELQSLMRNNALLSRPNVLFTPHCAFNTVEALEQINTVTVRNIRAALCGKPINLVPH